MLFKDVVDHLRRRRFCERRSWNGNWVLVIGVDNLPMMHGKNRIKTPFTMNLAEVNADDWERLPFTWGDIKDDYKPFEQDVFTACTLEEAEKAGVVVNHNGGSEFVEKLMMKCKTCGIKKPGWDTVCKVCHSLSCYDHSIVVDGSWYCLECAKKAIEILLKKGASHA